MQKIKISNRFLEIGRLLDWLSGLNCIIETGQVIFHWLVNNMKIGLIESDQSLTKPLIIPDVIQ